MCARRARACVREHTNNRLRRKKKQSGKPIAADGQRNLLALETSAQRTTDNILFSANNVLKCRSYWSGARMLARPKRKMETTGNEGIAPRNTCYSDLCKRSFICSPNAWGVISLETINCKCSYMYLFNKQLASLRESTNMLGPLLFSHSLFSSSELSRAVCFSYARRRSLLASFVSIGRRRTTPAEGGQTLTRLARRFLFFFIVRAPHLFSAFASTRSLSG